MEISIQERLNLKNSRIRNYIRFAINSKKEAEKLYNNNFNPFYKWRIGNLSDDKIKEAIIYFVNKNETKPEVINYGEETIIKYSRLLKVFEKLSNRQKPESLTNKEWFEIREEYERETKKERERSFGIITFEEKSNPQKDSQSEYDVLDFIKEDIENILADVYEGNWSITIVREIKDTFNHRLIIINLSLPVGEINKILAVASGKLQDFFLNNYDRNELAIKKINDSFFIECYFQYSEDDYR